MFTFTNRVPAGFSLMVWQLSNVGGVAGCIDKCKQYGLDGVFLKGADGDSQWTNQFTADIVRQFHAAGIGIIGWHYVYGGPGNNAPAWSSVAGEIAAAKYILSTGADGYLFDDEVEYDNKPAMAMQACQEIRAAYPDKSIGYNPYPYPSSDVNHPFFEFNSGCDYCMPQLYSRQDGLGTPTQALAIMEHDFAKWSPVWAARPGGRAAIPLCIDWQGASWPGAVSPDSDITEAARISVGRYPCISYWDMDSLTSGEWAAVTQASQIWHGGGTTGMWTRQADGSGSDGQGNRVGSGVYDYMVAHNLTNAKPLTPNEVWEKSTPDDQWGQVALDDWANGGASHLITIRRQIDPNDPNRVVHWDISEDKYAGNVWWAAYQATQALQAQWAASESEVTRLRALLAAVPTSGPVDPTLAAEAAAGRAMKAAITTLLAVA